MPLWHSLMVRGSKPSNLGLSSTVLGCKIMPARGGDALRRCNANSANTLPAEVERASENLAKSGKPFGGFSSAASTSSNNSRRESMPMMGAPRPYPEQQGMPAYPYNTRPENFQLTDTDARYGNQQRHHSVSEYDGARAHSASNAQGFYQNQRFAPRPNDADQMAQAKRRMAAQRERELRNYHQEQQYHRSKDSESGQQ